MFGYRKVFYLINLLKQSNIMRGIDDVILKECADLVYIPKISGFY